MLPSLTSLWHLVGGDRAKFFPDSSSTAAHQLNGLSLYLLGMSLFFTIGIFAALTIFVIKYRRRPGNEVAHAFPMHVKLEVTWTVIPLIVTLVAFAWGGEQFLELSAPPQNAESIFVVGKQWMWKIEHENGVTEINELHVPFGRDVQLIMISQDVIHSFFIPDFRMKFDVLPGRYTRAWFHAEKPGEYHFLCTQYCGTDHSEMIGTVFEMTESDYKDWLDKTKLSVAQTAEQRGSHLFASHGCSSCHAAGADIGPSLAGLYGSVVRIAGHSAGHSTAIADANYIRESILNPHAKVVEGYRDVMPTYAGQMSESEIFDLIQFLRHLEPASGKGVSFNDQKP